MNSSSRIQSRQILSHSMAGQALLFSAVFLTLVSLARAAPIDQSSEYGATNRLTVAGPATYQHEVAGNLVQMTAPATIVFFHAEKFPI